MYASGEKTHFDVHRNTRIILLYTRDGEQNNSCTHTFSESLTRANVKNKKTDGGNSSGTSSSSSSRKNEIKKPETFCTILQRVFDDRFPN